MSAICIILVTGSVAAGINGPGRLALDIGTGEAHRTRPCVKFDHDRHVRAGYPCDRCHRSGNSSINVSGKSGPFGGIDKNFSTEVKRELYHSECISCHKMVSHNDVTVPLFCGECHKNN